MNASSVGLFALIFSVEETHEIGVRSTLDESKSAFVVVIHGSELFERISDIALTCALSI